MSYQFDEYGNLKEKSDAEIAAIETEADVVIVLNQGTTDDGKPYWAYVAVRPSRYRAFMRAPKVVFSEYGTLLEYGFDKGVPAHIREKMREQYGCDAHYEEKREKRINAAREVFLKQRDSKFTGIVDMLKNKDASQE